LGKRWEMSRSMQRSRWGNFSGADVVVGAGGGMGGPGTSCCWVNRCRKWWMTGWRSPRPVVSAKILRLSPSVHEAPKKTSSVVVTRRQQRMIERLLPLRCRPMKQTNVLENLYSLREIVYYHIAASGWIISKQNQANKTTIINRFLGNCGVLRLHGAHGCNSISSFKLLPGPEPCGPMDC